MKKSEKPIGKIKVKKSIFKRLFFHILVLFILAVIVSGTLNFIENIQRTRRFTRQLTESALKVATETFERCDINALLDNPDSEEYRKAVKTLRWICQTNHLEYMYIYIPNFDENKVTYVMTVADDDSENENVLKVRSAGAEVDHSLWDAEKEAWENPNLVTAYEYQNDSFGSFYTAFSAIQGKDGKPVALIGADYSLTQIYTEIIFYTAMRVLALFVVLAIVFLLVVRFVRKKMYNPILLIFEKIRGYFSDKADGTNTKKAFVPIKLGSDDEIQLLADYFNDMAHDVETYVEKNSALASEKAKNETELEVARRIQYGIIAREKNVVFADCFDVSARMESARQVGGDFYDCFALPDGRICAVVGDVSGKGVEAAVVASMAKTGLAAYVWEKTEPDEMVSALNSLFLNFSRAETFATMCVVLVDLPSRSAKYCSAGHPPAMLVHAPDSANPSLELLATQSPVVGAFEGMRYISGSFTFELGDVLFLYTDGTTEARSPSGGFFGEGNLRDALLRACRFGLDDIPRRVLKEVEEFSGNDTHDDIAMVAVRFDGLA